MSEWRTLPEFPDYQVTEEGDVRNKWTHQMLSEVHNKKTGAYSYSLRREDGRSTCRNFWGLVVSAFPELKIEKEPVEPKVPSRIYARRGQYKTLADYPKYQIHPDGKIRYIHTRRPRPTIMEDGVEYVWLFNDEGSVKRRVSEVLAETFPETQEEAA